MIIIIKMLYFMIASVMVYAGVGTEPHNHSPALQLPRPQFNLDC